MPAGDIADKGVAFAQDGKLRGREKMSGLVGERHADDQMVDLLREEIAQGGFVQAGEPAARDRSVRVTSVRHNEAVVFLGLWAWSRACGVGDDVHAHGLSDTSNLTADAAITKDAETLADFVAQRKAVCIVKVSHPLMLQLG